MTIETIVRPFIGQDTTPVRTVRAGQSSVEPVLVVAGRKGGARTFAWSGSASMTSYLIRIHRERGNVRSALNGGG
jgi:hypothetical protein